MDGWMDGCVEAGEKGCAECGRDEWTGEYLRWKKQQPCLNTILPMLETMVFRTLFSTHSLKTLKQEIFRCAVYEITKPSKHKQRLTPRRAPHTSRQETLLLIRIFRHKNSLIFVQQCLPFVGCTNNPGVAVST